MDALIVLVVTPDEPDRLLDYYILINQNGRFDATWYSLHGPYPQSHGIDSSIYYIWRYP